MGDEWYKSTPNMGEIKPYEPDAMDKWAQSESFVPKLSYGLVNSFYVIGQNLFTKIFRSDDAAFNLDGTVTTVDENIDAFIGVGTTFTPIGGTSLVTPKLLRGSGGKINGISFSRGAGYGAKPRFDIHPLTHPSRRTSILKISDWLKKYKIPIPHYRHGKGSNLKYHRPWEISPAGQRKL